MKIKHFIFCFVCFCAGSVIVSVSAQNIEQNKGFNYPCGTFDGFGVDDATNDSLSEVTNFSNVSWSYNDPNFSGTFVIPELTSSILVNRTGVPQSSTEYDWSFFVNIDDTASTGSKSPLILGVTGADYRISLTKFAGGNKMLVPITSLQASIWKYDNEINIWHNIGDANTDVSGSALFLWGKIPGLNQNSKITARAYDYYPQGGTTGRQWEFLEGCTTDFTDKIFVNGYAYNTQYEPIQMIATPENVGFGGSVQLFWDIDNIVNNYFDCFGSSTPSYPNWDSLTYQDFVNSGTGMGSITIGEIYQNSQFIITCTDGWNISGSVVVLVQ
ncbi:MAG: hypothetical protein R3E90_06070 [Marinicella sp.]